MLVHKNQEQTNRLVNHLSKDFDVYVHIDANSEIKINNNKRVYVYKKYKTKWGSFNIVNATLLLLKNAYKKDAYERYILLSGQDLPLKTNADIISFFTCNENEYIETNKISFKQWNHKKIICNIMNNFIKQVFKYDFYCGSQWFNLTKSSVKKILNYIVCNKIFLIKYHFLENIYWKDCSDEKFFQTLIHLIGDVKIVNDNLRYIDWTDQYKHPLILHENDYDKIIHSTALFARKFDDTVDNGIIEKIYLKTDG